MQYPPKKECPVKKVITVNIPEALLADHRSDSMILRTANLGTLLPALREEDMGCVVYIQVLDPAADFQPLLDLENAGPVEVVLQNTEAALPQLYRLADVVKACSVRVSLAVSPGFLKPLRLAASLHCAVKLEVGQPAPPVVAEMLDALEFYLHGTGVTEPIEFFHSLLMACFHDVPLSLWDIQEEDPATFRHITDDGRETPVGRLAGIPLAELLTADGACNTEYLSAHAECGRCPHRPSCGGYFKWPDPTYSCKGIKGVFARIQAAAQDLKGDIAAHARAMSGGDGE
jgi:hypothetical protein